MPKRPFGWNNCLRLLEIVLSFSVLVALQTIVHIKSKQNKGKIRGKKGQKGGNRLGKREGKKKKGKRVCARNRHNVAKLAFWQGSCALIWAQVGSFLPLWPYKKREVFEWHIGVKWHIVLMLQKMSLYSNF